MKVGRNDPCPCGNGKKYRNCCYLESNDEPLLFELSEIPEKPKPVEKKAAVKEDFNLVEALKNLPGKPSIDMKQLTNMRMGFMHYKPHILKYKRLRKMHQEVIDAMVDYYQSGKFKSMIDGDDDSQNRWSKNFDSLESDFDTETNIGIMAFYDFLVYKPFPNVNCITEDFIKNRRYRKPEKLEFLQNMLNSELGLFEITRIEMMEGYAHIKNVFTGAEQKIIDIGLSGQIYHDDYYIYTRIITHRGISFGTGLSIVYKKTDKFIMDHIEEYKNNFKPEHEFIRFAKMYSHYSQYEGRVNTFETFEA